MHGKRVHHVQITPVAAQFADTRRNPHFGFFFQQFRAGKKHVSWRAATFAIHRSSQAPLFVPYYSISRSVSLSSPSFPSNAHPLALCATSICPFFSPKCPPPCPIRP